MAVAALGIAGCTRAAGGTPHAGAPGQAGQARQTQQSGPVVAVSPSGTAPINPLAHITVRAVSGTLRSVTVTNPVGKRVSGGFAPDKASWSTNEVLGYAKAYRVVTVAVGKDGKPVRRSTVVRTLTPRAQAYPSVIPAPSMSTFGVGQPLAVRFDQPIADRAAAQRALKVTTSPAQPGGWYWISDQQVDYRPEAYWRPGTRITLQTNVYGVNLGNGVYGETDRTIQYQVHDSWVAMADGLSEQMRIYQNGALVKSMPISMGKDSTPTHIGVHVISQKSQEYTMNSCSYGVCSGPDAYVAKEYWAERISNDGEFVHENPNSVADQGNTNVSHGCINLNEANAIWFFAHFGLGDVVEVTNSGGQPLPIYDTWGDWAVPWSIWHLGNATS